MEEALDNIASQYEKVNHIISIFQDEKIREKGLSYIYKTDGIGLELEPGLGNFTHRILDVLKEELICIDYSNKMLTEAKKRVKDRRVNLLRGVFEDLPFREKSINLTVISYALRDSKEKIKVIKEIRGVLRSGGRLLIIDIGKPNNRLIKSILLLYLKFIVPIISGLSTRRSYKNPWSLLYNTYLVLPSNKSLLNYLKILFRRAYIKEFLFGGLIIAIAEKNN